MIITPNMSLTVWDNLSDTFNHSELQTNFETLDAHDHTSGNGVQLPEGALAADSVAGVNLKDGSITGNKIVDGTINATKLAEGTLGEGVLGDGSVTPDKLALSIREDLGLTDTTSVRRGSFIRTNTDTRADTAYGTLTTPDVVADVVLPTAGLIHIAYLAAVYASDEIDVAIFLDTTQVRQTDAPAPVVAETGLDPGAAWQPIFTSAGSTSGWTFELGATYTGDVTTGQILNPVSVFADAGTYDVSIQYKVASGTVSVKNRRLLVWTTAF
jgi:hypothetical protein